jgi:hypothetical protein
LVVDLFIRSEPAAGTHQPHDQQKQYGADCGIDDLRQQPGPETDSELGKQIACHQRAGDADKDIADDSETRPAYDLSGQPTATRPTNRMTRMPSLDICMKNTPVRARGLSALRFRA